MKVRKAIHSGFIYIKRKSLLLAVLAITVVAAAPLLTLTKPAYADSSFSEGFEGGNLSNWDSHSSTSPTVCTSTACSPDTGTYAVDLSSSNTSGGVTLTKNVSNTYPTSDVFGFFELQSASTNATLFNFATSGGSHLFHVYYSNATGELGIRTDTGTPATYPGCNNALSTSLPWSAYHLIEARTVIASSGNSVIQIWVDGQPVTLAGADGNCGTSDDSATLSASIGNTNVGQVILGDTASNRTFDYWADAVTIRSMTTGSVTGTVTRLDGTTPISGAAVAINGSSVVGTITDANGNYTLTGVTPSVNQTVVVNLAGYLSSSATVNVSSNSSAAQNFSLTKIYLSDGFESGGLSNWSSSTNVTTCTSSVSGCPYAGTYSAESTASGSTAAYAKKTLSSTASEVYVRARVYIRSQGSNNVTLLQLASSSTALIAHVFLNSSHQLGIRDDYAVTTTQSTTAVSTGTWHTIEFHAKINGTSSTTDVTLDGTAVGSLSSTSANLGTNNVYGVWMGENQTGRTYDVLYDGFRVQDGYVGTGPDQPGNQTIHVSGTLSSNQEWQSDNVYVVDNTVTVPDGVTLTIDPGVVVKYQLNSNNGIEVDSGGTLNANGTSSNPVTFTSLKDDTAGGDTNGDGSASSPAAGDYENAIDPGGGTVTVSRANFKYGASDIDDNTAGVNTGSSLTVTDSSFTSSDVGIRQVNDNSISLQRNSFNLGTPGNSNYAIDANENDLSGIVLAGTNKNTFSGSGTNVAVAVQGGVTSGQTWGIASGPVLVAKATINGTGMGVDVYGTVNLDPGLIIKATGNSGFVVHSGGTLNASGTSTDPVVFTSFLDDSTGGDTNGNGIANSPSPTDYVTAIEPNGGTLNISHAEFEFAQEDIGMYNYPNNSGSQLSVTDSSFTNSYMGIDQINDSSISLQRNSFALNERSVGSGSYPIDVTGSDLSGIILSGTNKNTFSGSGSNNTVVVQGNVPTGSTWTIDSGPVLWAHTNGETGITVDGTVNVGAGAIVKVDGSPEGFKVEADGTLNASGTSTDPVVFTAYTDDSIGGDSNEDEGANSPSAGAYGTAIRFEEPSSSDVLSNIVFKYASQAISIGVSGTVSVDNSQFTNNVAAFAADTTSTENPALGSLAPTCLWPYTNRIDITNSWFGAHTATGYPGNNINIDGYLGREMPSGDEASGLQAVYNEFTTLQPFTVDSGDNTIPWTIFSCGIPDTDISVQFPVTPVWLPNFTNLTAIADEPLWTASNYEE